jgi:hypothetical protein
MQGVDFTLPVLSLLRGRLSEYKAARQSSGS